MYKITKRPKKTNIKYTKTESYVSEYTCPACKVTFVGAGINKRVLRFKCKECGQVLIVEKIEEVAYSEVILNMEYKSQKERAIAAGKSVSNLCFVETMAEVLEASTVISGGRSSEVMAMIAHLLKCRKTCEEHLLMREVLEENYGVNSIVN